MYFWDVKAELSAVITPVFSVTWSFRNHSNMHIFHFYIYIINDENSRAA